MKRLLLAVLLLTIYTPSTQAQTVSDYQADVLDGRIRRVGVTVGKLRAENDALRSRIASLESRVLDLSTRTDAIADALRVTGDVVSGNSTASTQWMLDTKKVVLALHALVVDNQGKIDAEIAFRNDAEPQTDWQYRREFAIMRAAHGLLAAQHYTICWATNRNIPPPTRSRRQAQ